MVDNDERIVPPVVAQYTRIRAVANNKQVGGVTRAVLESSEMKYDISGHALILRVQAVVPTQDIGFMVEGGVQSNEHDLGGSANFVYGNEKYWPLSFVHRNIQGETEA